MKETKTFLFQIAPRHPCPRRQAGRATTSPSPGTAPSRAFYASFLRSGRLAGSCCLSAREELQGPESTLPGTRQARPGADTSWGSWQPPWGLCSRLAGSQDPAGRALPTCTRGRVAKGAASLWCFLRFTLGPCGLPVPQGRGAGLGRGIERHTGGTSGEEACLSLSIGGSRRTTGPGRGGHGVQEEPEGSAQKAGGG